MPFYLTIQTFSPQNFEFIAFSVIRNCEFTYNSEGKKVWIARYELTILRIFFYSVRKTRITTKNNFVLLFVFEVTIGLPIIFTNFKKVCCWVFFHNKMLSFFQTLLLTRILWLYLFLQSMGYTFETYLLKFKLAHPLPF